MPDHGIVFLMYHELELPGRAMAQEEPGYVRYILPRKAFLAQMQWLHQHGWRGLSVSEALLFPAEKSVAITFDDGCETDLIAAAPVLSELGFRATAYVTVGFLDKPGYLTAAQLRQLHSSGFEIGCHSMTHSYLNDLSTSALRMEIRDAKIKLEEIIGGEVEHFSCPGGRYDARTIAMAKYAGYRSVANSRAHANTGSTDSFRLGRVAVMRDTELTAFSKICSASGLWKTRLSESARESARILLGNTLYDRVRGRLLGKR